jgi:radical SAM family uncharacterized protein
MKDLELILNEVEKPSRYIGNEHNIVIKDWNKVKLKVALAFPDLYEIGMSHLGFQIIYHLLNNREDTLCERVFAPGIDLENLLRDRKLPLFSLETKRPINNFDWLAFSLSYELTYSGILTILNLSHIPIFSKNRDESYPLIIAGGPTVLNPEPIADFFDVIFIGEAEEALNEIIDVYLEWKESKENKTQLFKELVKIKGIYIPSLYKAIYEKDKFKELIPLYPWAPTKISRRIVYDLEKAPFPTRPIVTIQQVAHDRGSIEIMRGCQRSCRFCFAGYIYRPKRYRSIETIRKYAKEMFENTGYEEISLLSLSTNDYPNIEKLLDALNQDFEGKYVNFSLPSLRADKFSLELAEKVEKNRKASLTFAIEAGTERLRKVINKNLREEEFFKTLDVAFSKGWNNIKLYFMIGLPTETDEDIYETVDLIKKIIKLNKRSKIHLSFSIFVPKPHTSFQWEKFEDREIIERRESILRKGLKSKNISIDFHDYNMSYLEAIFSRGDRRLSDILNLAWKMGSRFESWTEFFKIDIWERIFNDLNIDPQWYIEEKSLDEPLPWDHISCGVSKSYLIKEREKAYKGEETPPCEWGISCDFCGVSHYG